MYVSENETTWINYTFSTFSSFPVFSVLHFALLLTLNRFAAIILPKYNVFFEPIRLYFSIALAWLSALGMNY